MASLDPGQAADSLLRAGLDQAIVAKAALRDALLRKPPRVPNLGSRLGELLVPSNLKTTVVADPSEEVVTDLTSDANFDAKLGLTTMVGRAKVRRSFEQLRPLLDPRSWSCSGGAIAAAFLVKDYQGQYRPTTELDNRPLGQSWENQLLYEYARSEVASFENILRITKFEAYPDRIRADYHLYDCLVCTFGMFSAPGGLTVNEGHVMAEPLPDGWWQIEVKKIIRVRDLTPHDPGNRYDFGEWINSTIGAALSQWVHDTSFMSPVA